MKIELVSGFSCDAGAQLLAADIEQHFIGYMFKQIVPPWVRHFARLVERLNRMGKLDRYALGVDRLPTSRAMVSKGLRYFVIAAATVASVIVLAEFTAQMVKLSDRCLFPPCY